jgi:hypothetical protein
MAMRDTYEIVEKEVDNQEGGKTDSATRKKFGPAASHQAGNPTSGGGINRPAKGKVS